MFRFIAIFLFFISMLTQAESNKELVVFAGSSTIMPIIEDMTDLLGKNGFDLQVQGGGSSAGLKSTKMGLAQVGMVSRGLTTREKRSYNNFVIAKDWVVLITHKSNPVKNLNQQQVYDIYSGKQDLWDSGKEVHAIGKEGGRATKKVFENHFKLRGKVRKSIIIIGANGQAIASVANDPDALAYVSYSAAIEAVKQKENIKIITLDNIAATPENILNQSYALTRSLNLVYLDKNEALMERLKIAFKSPEAMNIFKKNHVMPTII